MINECRLTARARHVEVQHSVIQKQHENGDISMCHMPGVINLLKG